MAAGLGFKNFASGEVLTAADVNGYLNSQTVMVFADSAARTAAITSPQEGMISYLKDTNVTQYYSGSAWVGVGAASPLTTKGDVYTYSTTDARIGVGANDTVLTADSSTATGLKWAAPSAGGMTLLSTTSLSGTTTTVSSINGTYNDLAIIVQGMSFPTSPSIPQFRFNGSDLVFATGTRNKATSSSLTYTDGPINFSNYVMMNSNANNVFVFEVTNYANTTRYKGLKILCNYLGDDPGENTKHASNQMGAIRTNSAITSFSVTNNEAFTFDGGQILIYGVK